jgi:hypothetical protein
VRRVLATTSLFALAVLLVVAIASLFTFARVRRALEAEFARRVDGRRRPAAEVQPWRVRRLERLGPAAFATSDSLLLALGGVGIGSGAGVPDRPRAAASTARATRFPAARPR